MKILFDLDPPIVMEAGDTLSKAMSEMSRRKSPVIVRKGKQYIGMVDDRVLRNLVADPSKIKLETLAKRTPIINRGMNLLDIVRLFFTSRFRTLPVSENDKFAGVITYVDLLAALMRNGLLEKARVSEVMSKHPVTIDESVSLLQAQAKMRDKNVRRLVVTRGEFLAGIISTFDLAGVIDRPHEKMPRGRERERQGDQQVKLFMRPEVITVSPADLVSSAARKMMEKTVAAVVVEEAQKPVGIITARDIFESVMRKEDEPKVYVSGLTEDEHSMFPQIVEMSKPFMEKFSKSFKIEYLALHVKGHGERKTVLARLMVGHVVTASATEWDLISAINTVMEELKKIMQKEKSKRDM
ncbi:MAG: CBS domain-containing protein [Candidatus Micrarchaeota archaeon]|nr:CBS domain-containing protein [Candidatus Micrarchaeota archaeon]